MTRSKKTGPGLFALASVLAIGAVLGSCRSMPLPNSSTESLLVIPSQMTNTLNNNQVRVIGASLTIRNEKTLSESTVRMRPGAPFSTIALEPGPYSIIQTRITLQRVGGRNPWTDTHTYYSSLFLEKRVVRYFERKFYVQSNPQGWYRWGFEYMEHPAEKARSLAELKKDPRWLAWQGYSLVNF